MYNWKSQITGILIFSVFITFFMHEAMTASGMDNTYTQFIGSFVSTAALWISNSYVFHVLYDRYPNLQDTRKRILIEILLMSVITTVITFVLYYLMCYHIFGIEWRVVWIELKFSFLFTSLAVIFHESVYFFKRWKESILAAEKLQKETAQAQLESLRSQINPHFLFNSLNTLVALIPLDSTRSVEFVRKLSEVYRYLLKARCTELTSLEDEMKMAKAYLFLLETRFQSAIQVSINIRQAAYALFVPPVSIQLLLENCIKHNIVSKEKTLRIEIFSEDRFLIVRNNLQKKTSDEESTGLGLMNIEKRYSILSDRKIEIQEDGNYFSVKLPLLEIEMK